MATLRSKAKISWHDEVSFYDMCHSWTQKCALNFVTRKHISHTLCLKIRFSHFLYQKEQFVQRTLMQYFVTSFIYSNKIKLVTFSEQVASSSPFRESGYSSGSYNPSATSSDAIFADIYSPAPGKVPLYAGITPSPSSDTDQMSDVYQSLSLCSTAPVQIMPG